jgi:hypothetical protein
VYKPNSDNGSACGKKGSTLDQEDEVYRMKLIGLAQSGLLNKFGINKSESELKKMTPKAVEKVWVEYENRYNACVSDDLISNMLFQVYEVDDARSY